MSMAMRSRQVTVRPDCPVDPVVMGSALALLFIGLLMVASATTEISTRTYGNPFYLFFKHAVFLAVGLGAAGLVLAVPLKVFEKLDRLLLLLGFGLLIAVLIPGVGREVNGSTRWISLGFFSLQGSEFVKLFLIIYIAGYLVRCKEQVQTTMAGFAKPLALVSLMVLLLLGQPDFGTAVVIMATTLGIIFLAGVPMKNYLPVILTCLVAAAFLATRQPYRLERLIAFTNPWAHQFDGGYQLTQALIAFGRGEFFGLGLGNSIQKQFFLPEAHTDFLFSITAEELGAIGALLMIALFATLVIRGFWIGKLAWQQGDEFNAYIAYGVSLLLGVQSAINIGVNLGLLPTKGLTLPFVSFGGNSLIVSCLLVALLLRAEFETRDEYYANRKGAKHHGR